MTSLSACQRTWSFVEQGGCLCSVPSGDYPRASFVALLPGPARLSGADDSSAGAPKPAISKAIGPPIAKWRPSAKFQWPGPGRKRFSTLAAQNGPPARDVEQAHQRRRNVGQGGGRQQSAGVRAIHLLQHPLLVEKRVLKKVDRPHARRLLTAAALTYVSASLMSLLNIARWWAIVRR